MKHFSDLISKIPNCPGVYLFKDKKEKIIYIGKSVNLRSRVASYFNGIMKLNFAKKQMVLQINNIDFIETKNEIEALVLETNLIKSNHPKYNILMKDDKNLAYIKITNEIIPQIIKIRQKNKDGEYFGPYPSTFNVINTIEVIQKIFKLRNCNIKFEKDGISGKLTIKGGTKNLPCLEYYINNCIGPCLLLEDKISLYLSNIESAKNFLKGNIKTAVQDLEDEMKIKAQNLQFEEASKIRDMIKSIKSLQEKQIVRDFIDGDNDVIIILEKYGKIFIGITQIRDSKIISINNIYVENKLSIDKEEVFNSFLQDKYIDYDDKKINLILQDEIIDPVLLSFLKEKGLNITYPKIGNKVEVINFTKNNILNFAYKRELSEIGKKTLTRKIQLNILDTLGYSTIETKNKKEIIFECFDISHLSGTNTVASRSVIINGKTDNTKYKKYNLKTIKGGEIDDFKSMLEILERRAQEIIKTGVIPDLIIIDGGKGQLNSAKKGIEKVFAKNYSNIDVNICSIAKREEEIFVIGKSEPIILPTGSQELMLIQKIRDEAHRFAINFNRNKRNKEIKKNILEELPGFGIKTRQKLLKIAGSIDNIKNIPEKDLMKIVNKNQLQQLQEYGIYLS